MSDKRTVQIYTYLNIPSNSICLVSSRWALELEKHFDVKVHNYSESDSRFPELDHLLGRHEVADFGIYFGYPSYIKTTGFLPIKDRVKMGVFACETDLKETEHTSLRLYHLVVVPSEYCVGKFSSAMDHNKVMKVPHGFNISATQGASGAGLNTQYDRYRKSPDKLVSKKFRVLTIFTGSFQSKTHERKNLMKALAAFDRLKVSIPHAEMTVKVSGDVQINMDGLQREHPGLRFVLNLLDNYEMTDMIRGHDVYLNTSMAEGFGIVPLEAMACETIVVSPIHSGLMEYMTPSNCVVIPSRRTTTKVSWGINHGFVYDMDVKDIAKALEKSYDSFEDLQERAYAISSFVKDVFSWESAMTGVIKWMKKRKL